MPADYLILVESGDMRREVKVPAEGLIVGRGPTAAIRLPDDYASREHGKFEVRGDDLYIVDLRSRNGIFVNGTRLLEEIQLDDGDEVRIGRSVMTPRRAMADNPATIAKRQNLEESHTKDLGPEGIQFVEPALELGFQLTKLVAISGMGLLFEARDSKSGQSVAFKILRPDRATEANVARAVEEAKSLSQIHHDNIVRILSTGRMKNGESFLVMGYVEGLTATQLGKAGRLWIPEALQIGSDMCSALHAVHRRGMVHRDVKPSNVMVEEETSRTVLIDFSLALTEAGGLASAPAGTIIFCAPEQVQPQTPDEAMNPSVDVYGLGASLYFMLCGHHPFRGSSTIEIQRKKLEGPIPVVAERLGPRGLPALDEILVACMQPKPHDRPSDMMEVKKLIDGAKARYPKARFHEDSRHAKPSPVRQRRSR
ncbi:MAG: FHA domain-containing serine/threonine-protein kinase [Planctomycetota bacterium]